MLEFHNAPFWQQSNCFDYCRVEEDWRHDLLKLSWMKENLKDDRYMPESYGKIII